MQSTYIESNVHHYTTTHILQYLRISAVGGLHHAEGVETACHAEGAEHVCHPCMHACVCAWDRRPDQRQPQHTFRSNQAVVRPHMRPSRCGGDGHARLFVMGGL